MRNRRWYIDIPIFFFFILLSFLATYPLIFKMGSYLYGPGGDALGSVWSIWWRKYAHLNHISSKVCPLVASPFGADFPSLARSVLWKVFSLPLSFLSNEVFTHNFFILVSFFLSAIIVYYLVYYFTKNKLASIISGVIYALCPYHFAHSACHLTLANIQWMPLYLLALFKLGEERTYRSAFFWASALFLTALLENHYGYFMVIVTLAFIFWWGWQGLRNKRLSGYPVTRLSGEQKPKSRIQDPGSRRHSFKVISVAVVVAVAIILPFTYSTFKTALFTPKTEEIMPPEYARPFRDLTSNSARPLGYLLPSQDNPFFGKFTKRFIKSPFYGGHPTEHTLYLGWVGIVLSIVAIRGWRRKNALMRNAERVMQANRINASSIQDRGSRIQRGVSFFLFTAIVALIFSHSPYTEMGPFRILFPSYFIYKIFPMFRCYARFGIVVMLCVSVLAGIGLASILERIRNIKKKRILLSVVLLLIFIEFAPTLPAPMVNAVNPPPVYEWLAKQEGDFIIAEYPLEDDQEYFFWQRIHQKRLVNGAQSRTYADEVRKEIVDILKSETPGILKYLGTRYVILHPDKYLKSEDVPVIGEVPDVSKQKGLKLTKTFKEVRVYKVIAEPVKPMVENRGIGETVKRRK